MAWSERTLFDRFAASSELTVLLALTEWLGRMAFDRFAVSSELTVS